MQIAAFEPKLVSRRNTDGRIVLYWNKQCAANVHIYNLLYIQASGA